MDAVGFRTVTLFQQKKRSFVKSLAKLWVYIAFFFVLESLYCQFSICKLQLQSLNCGTRTEKVSSPCKKLFVNCLHDIISGLLKLYESNVYFRKGIPLLALPSFRRGQVENRQTKPHPMCATNRVYTFLSLSRHLFRSSVCLNNPFASTRQKRDSCMIPNTYKKPIIKAIYN